jgi:protein translocase SecG subunit|tara:strand:- start:3003 stop:3221 length:219 start_codon:yes stop_codon:yes gene_type:complete
MNILENTWFLIAFLIIGIVLLVDPKSSISGSNNSSILGVFSSPSSGQQFIYRFSAVVIASFFLLSLGLSYSG